MEKVLFWVCISLWMTSYSAEAAILKECRDRIPKLLCFAKPSSDLFKELDKQGKKEDRCLSSAKIYTKSFQEIYDRYPENLQRMFCALKHIYIETSQTWINAYCDSEKASGGQDINFVLGVHERNLASNSSFIKLSALREQKSFGNKTDEIEEGLPVVETQDLSHVNVALYKSVAHEFGHVLDQMNQLNPDMDRCYKSPDSTKNPECPVTSKQWATFSWTNTKKPIASDDFLLRTKFCYVFCDHFGGSATREQAVEMFKGMEKTSFLTTFSTLEPWDDWADSLAFYLLKTRLNIPFVVNTNQGFRYDVMAKIDSEQFSAKRKYIEKFLKRKDLVYPKITED
jgi:hypothetical protein